MKKVLSFAMMALMMGYVFVSCDEEKLTPEEEKKPVVPSDSIPSDSVPSDTTQVPADTVFYTLSMSLPKADSIYLSTDTTVTDDFEYYYIDTIRVNPFKLVHSVSTYGGFGMAFTYSSLTDTVTPGYVNNAAITGCGVNSNSYFTVNTGGDMWGIDTEITFEEGKAYVAKECYVTNSTYAYRAIKDHNDGGSGLVKEWTADDSFTLTITGYNGETETGQVEFKLADGFNIVKTWEKVDLSSLGEVTTLHFGLTSTDNGQWGMNTPTYFCLDQLIVTDK